MGRRKNSIRKRNVSKLSRKRKILKLLITAWIALALLVGVVGLAVAATPQGRAAARAFGFVAQVLPAVPVKPAEWFAAEPERIRIAYPLRGGSGDADLYLPAGGGEHSAILLFLGINPAGRNDARVVNLAEALARTGVAVMAPWSDNMTQKRVAAEEIDDLVRAFQHLRAHDRVDGDRVGMAGFCVGASFLTAAAQDERINENVSVLNSFGGYYDAADLMAAVIARQRFYDGDVRAWQPDALSVEVTRLHLADTLTDAAERELLLQALADGGAAPDGVSDEALAVYALLNAPDVETARRLMDGLPSDARDTLRRISPSSGIDRLRAKLLVMHDREDSLVPSEESRRLVEALPPDAGVYYTEFSFFDHVDPSRPVGRIEFAREGAKLFLHMYRIMRELP